MQFLIVARDGTDPGAPTRRQQHRPAHLAAMARERAAGHLLFGGAILDDLGNMVGSAVLMEFPDRAQLDARLATDPYVTGGVWRQIEVQPFRLAHVD